MLNNFFSALSGAHGGNQSGRIVRGGIATVGGRNGDWRAFRTFRPVFRTVRNCAQLGEGEKCIPYCFAHQPYFSPFFR